MFLPLSFPLSPLPLPSLSCYFSTDSFSSSLLLLSFSSGLVWFKQRWTEASLSSSSSSPLLENRARVAGFFSPPCPHCPPLSLRFCQRGLREAALLSSLPFILFFPPYLVSLSLCLHPPPASVSLSLSEPVGSQTERVSRGLERGIISLLLPPLAPSHSLSITVFIPPPPPPPLHLLLLHHQQHHTNPSPLLFLTAHCS